MLVKWIENNSLVRENIFSTAKKSFSILFPSKYEPFSLRQFFFVRPKNGRWTRHQNTEFLDICLSRHFPDHLPTNVDKCRLLDNHLPTQTCRRVLNSSNVAKAYLSRPKIFLFAKNAKSILLHFYNMTKIIL